MQLLVSHSGLWNVHKWCMCSEKSHLFYSQMTPIFFVLGKMIKLKQWLSINKWSFNLNKTTFMLFGNRFTDTQVQMMIDVVNVERVYENKLLGVILDHKTCLKCQIIYVRTKLAKSIKLWGKQNTYWTINHCAFCFPYLYHHTWITVWNTYKSNHYAYFKKCFVTGRVDIS